MNPIDEIKKRIEAVPQFSSFGRRLAALLIDMALILPLLFYFGYAQVPLGYEMGVTFDNFGMILVVLYYAVLEGSPLRASLGKLATSQYVANEYGEKIGFLHAIGRSLAKVLTLVTAMLGFLSILFTRRNQALHDLISRTSVMTKYEN